MRPVGVRHPIVASETMPPVLFFIARITNTHTHTLDTRSRHHRHCMHLYVGNNSSRSNSIDHHWTEGRKTRPGRWPVHVDAVAVGCLLACFRCCHIWESSIHSSSSRSLALWSRVEDEMDWQEMIDVYPWSASVEQDANWQSIHPSISSIGIKYQCVNQWTRLYRIIKIYYFHWNNLLVQ